jgi:tetratricopeptide (TPR) repeat protein
MRRHLACLVALLVLSPAAPALADSAVQGAEARSKAAADTDRGVALYRARDYRAALTRFERAYDRYPSNKLLFNIAITLEALDRRAEAAQAYRRFLDEGPPVDDPRTRTARLAVARLSPPAPTAAAAASDRRRPPPPRRRVWTWLAAGTSLGLAGSGVVVHLGANAAMRDAGGNIERRRDADDQGAISTILFAGAAAAAITSGALFFLEDRGAALSVSPTAGGGGMTVGIRGTLW